MHKVLHRPLKVSKIGITIFCETGNKAPTDDNVTHMQKSNFSTDLLRLNPNLPLNCRALKTLETITNTIKLETKGPLWCIYVMDLPLLTLFLTVFTSAVTTAPQHKKALTEDTEMHSPSPFCTFFSHAFVKKHQKPVQFIFCPHRSNCSSRALLPRGRCFFFKL